MRLYLIGPVTGIEEGNRPAFYEAAAVLEAEGHVVCVPHDILPEGVADWRGAMLHCLHRLTVAHDGIPYYQGVAMLGGWEGSRGARLEHDVAEALGIPCRPWREWLDPAKGAAAYAHRGAAQPALMPAC